MFLIITMVVLIIAMFFVLIKMVKGPTLWDRLMCLNLISAHTILLITIYGIYKENSMLLDIAISYGIIGFLTITLLSRFLLRGGRQK
ncbi:monovalent cation/H+ antiporter complex subunit F [Senegalia massiliensis]|uniref:monovalent cation/H+ antiporter complex subunit F n=1 Tax=Senegalia massiliensis TaxID=1720316 RepID=UPI001031213A|nr:monovalent cation/H+ antiporter complex subunit F [Senegalia massiliensis]